MLTPRQQAALRGEMHYHGRPCSRCGGTLRYTKSANCVHCTRRRVRIYADRLRRMMEDAHGSGSDH